MHLPLTCIVPSGATVQACSADPLQSHITILVSFTAESPLSSTHLALPSPETIGPVGCAVKMAGALAPESPAVVRVMTVMV
jgi:hypothetical protein